MTRVAIFSLLRDRLLYTQTCFKTLREKAGYLYDHYIIENGSQDGTALWVLDNADRFKHCTFNRTNLGLCAGNNQALQIIRDSGISYDFIAKMDNDAEMVTDNIVAGMVDVFDRLGKPALLSPRVTGISKQPTRRSDITLGDRLIGITNHIGGLFAWCNADVYLDYTYPDNLPLASGDDSAFAYWVYKKGYPVGYVENLVVNHYETTELQQKRYPEYFLRKWQEEKVNEKF